MPTLTDTADRFGECSDVRVISPASAGCRSLENGLRHAVSPISSSVEVGRAVSSTRVLAVTSIWDDAEDLTSILGNGTDGFFVVEQVKRLSEAETRLGEGGIQCVIADLALPDSQGIETFDRLLALALNIPILVLVELGDDPLAAEAMQRGAQGYFRKGQLHSTLVPQSLRNIIQRKRIAETFFLDKARAEITLNSISDAVLGTDLGGRIDYLNRAAESMTGWTRADARGHPVCEVFHLVDGVTGERRADPSDWVLANNQPMKLAADTLLLRRDGSKIAIEDSASPIHDQDGKLVGTVIVFHDVTTAKAMTVKMKHLAQHDSLTHLPNRLLLNDRIEQAISLAERKGTHLSVLFLDLDHFKHINDSLGHATGDKLLQGVAERLSACVRTSDTVSRQGGDEFVLLLSHEDNAGDSAVTADKILAALSAPFLISGHQLQVTSSIGISSYPDDALTAGALLMNADIAMYQAKQQGRNNYQFFKSDMNVRAVMRQDVEAKLQQALQRQEFVLHYQAKVDLDTGSIIGAEALLRWMQPEWGMTLPTRFVSIAEECGLIVPIGRWVLREACAEAQRWHDAGLKCGPLSVNISALEFRRKDFVEMLRGVLDDTGLAPAALQLEITESALMENAEVSALILKQIKQLGVGLAVDDFGTGYSSLSYLTQFPIDVLKIDQSFVQAIGSTREHGIVISAVIAMGNSLDQKVIAEGIESAEQLVFLKARGCNAGQGNLFSDALAPDVFARLLSTGLNESMSATFDDWRGTQEMPVPP